MHISAGDRPVSPYFESLIAKYGAVLLGVSIGTAAKYSLSMGEGRKITAAEVVSDLLLAPMMVLISATIGARLGADPMTMTTVAAFVAVSSDRFIRMLRDKFMQRAAAEIDLINRQKGEQRQLGQIEQSAAHLRDEGLNAPTAATSMIRVIEPTPAVPGEPTLNIMRDEI